MSKSNTSAEFFKTDSLMEHIELCGDRLENTPRANSQNLYTLVADIEGVVFRATVRERRIVLDIVAQPRLDGVFSARVILDTEWQVLSATVDGLYLRGKDAALWFEAFASRVWEALRGNPDYTVNADGERGEVAAPAPVVEVPAPAEMPAPAFGVYAQLFARRVVGWPAVWIEM